MRPSFTSLARCLAACLAGLSLPASLHAQGVVFWRSVTEFPAGHSTVLPVQTYSGIAPPSYLFTANGYYRLDPTAGTLGPLSLWNTLVRATSTSEVTFVPAGSSANSVYVTGQQNRLAEFSIATNNIILPQHVLPAGDIPTVFNSSTQTFVVLSNKLYTYDRAAGTVTQVVDNLSGVLRGAVGANNTIWLLTSNNGTVQVQSLSGDGSYTPGASFAVRSGANGMAVSQWGTIYVSSFADGVTTVTAYNTSGQVLQTFASLSGDLMGGGTTYLNVNSRGVIDLVDGTRNLYQQWFDPMAFGATLAIPAGTYSAAIGGSESIAAFSTGTATLTGTNTYSGNTVLVNGTLAFGTASSLSANTSLTFAGGTLQISPDFVPATGALRTTTDAAQDIRVDTNGQSTALTVNATGNSTLTKSGEGTLTIANDATYTGDTTISAGTLRIGDGGTTGSLASPSIVNNAALVFDRSDASTYAGAISGTGSVTKNGAGTLTLSGANTYTGATTLGTGTLALGSADALGASGPIGFTGGTLQFSASNTTDYSGRFSTAAGQLYRVDTNGQSVTLATALTSDGGSLVKLGAGTLTLSGVNTYSGGTTFAGGTVAIAANTALGSGGFTFDGGTLASTSGMSFTRDTTLAAGGGTLHNDSGFLTLNGNISGAGGLTKTGSRILTLAGAHTYTGATTVSAGTLKFAANGATASALATSNLDIASGAKVIFADSQTYAGGVTGAGVLEHEFGGTTILTGAANHTGGTSIIAGTIQVGTGGTAGSLAGNVALSSGGTLAFNRSDASTFAGVISGTGAVTKSGAGTLTLSGASTFTGNTTITAGRLNVTGSAANSAFTVSSGGTLSGTGTVGALTIASGGTLSPGNSPGTLNAGATTFSGGGAFTFEINNATGVSGNNYDLLAISGGLTIAATSGNKFTINVSSLTLGNAAGLAANFDAAANYSFTFVTTTGGISGFATNAFALNTSAFQNPFTGTWSVAQSGNHLTLNYTGAVSAVPEPSTYAAMAGGAMLGFAVWRRRRQSTKLQPPSSRETPKLQTTTRPRFPV